MNKLSSRKYRMARAGLICATLLLLIPGLFNLMVGTTVILLTGSEYVSLMLGIYGLYFAGNVAEKHKSFVQEDESNKENK